MKKLLILALILCVFGSLAFAQQDDSDQRQSRSERYRELFNYRVTQILSALELDATSSKGSSLLTLIKNHSSSAHSVMASLSDAKKQMFDLVKNKSTDAEIVNALLLVEQLEKELVDIHSSYQDELHALLTPLERAQMRKCEDEFRKRLRRSTQRSGNSKNQRNSKHPDMPF